MGSAPYRHLYGPGLETGFSKESLERLYRDHWQDLCRQLKRIFGAGPPDPEDVAQAAFVRLAALENPESVRNPRAFLLTTARNIALDYKRRQALQFRYAQSVLAEHSALTLDELSPERVFMERERFELIAAAMDRLPHKQRTVLHLHRHEGLTYQQIANETGWSYGDVYRQMEAALVALAAAVRR